ncbi:polyadenylate-binding protein RBP45-like [Iris pallida]|uniref:Polyadenylate-binding protein RBP45-like n=1 Tax=Iris pallida TaxID=29817 RepID=A0AAX6FZY7_IRIPA|nr:polyadenylate-binding protein RBP45-like [Iris pallida]
MMQQPAPMAPPPAPVDPNQQQPPQQQHYQSAPPPQQQWPMMAPPPPAQYQQQYAAQPPQPMWNHQPSQIPPPAPPAQVQPMMAQYQQPALSAAPANDGEIRTLWIGDLQYWMDENYLHSCFVQTGELLSAKVIRNKQTGQSDGYGFIEFATRATAEHVLQTYNGQMMPNIEQAFRLNWAAAGERRGDDGPDYTIFVGDLASDVTDYQLQETFKTHYPSVKGAKIVTDRTTGRSKGYGFVRFADLNEQTRAMTEMNGMFCSTRPMRVGPATTKKSVGAQPQNLNKASYQSTPGSDSENDPNNTTIFVGGLDPNVTDENLRQVFSQYGELIHVKIPMGKRCGFVQFAQRACAEEALLMLNGSMLGTQNIRLSWGRTPNKQTQPDGNQWNSNYYGYAQGYDTYGYQPPQDPNMYAYAAYPGYANYQQQGNYQQQQ